MINAMEDVPYIDRLKLLNLSSLQGRLLRSDMNLLWKIFKSLSPMAIKPDMLFQAAPLASTRGHPFNIFVPQSQFEIRKRCFIGATLEHL